MCQQRNSMPWQSPKQHASRVFCKYYLILKNKEILCIKKLTLIVCVNDKRNEAASLLIGR